MRITYDDQYLITVSDDASLFIHKLTDKEGRGKREKEVTYAEEILITKSDLEEKVRPFVISKLPWEYSWVADKCEVPWVLTDFGWRSEVA